MPVVPTYEDRGIRLDPGLNFRDNTKATAEMFGSGIGTALGTAGKGLTDIGQAVSDAAIAKEKAKTDATKAGKPELDLAHVENEAAANVGVQRAAAGLTQLKSGGGGEAPADGSPMGTGPVVTFLQHQADMDAVVKGVRDNLSSDDARAIFDGKVAPILFDAKKQALEAQAQARKGAIQGAYMAGADAYRNHAVDVSADETDYQNSLALGLKEIEKLGFLQRWEPEHVEQVTAAYISEARKRSTLKLADTNPLAALNYSLDHAADLSLADKMALNDAMQPALTAALRRDAAHTSQANPASDQFAATNLPPAAYVLLGAIGQTEAPSYDAQSGGGRFDDFSKHPGMVGFGGTSTKAGRYGLDGSTWEFIAAKTGLTDFSPASQDRGAWALAQKNYRDQTNRSLEDDIKAGRWAAIRETLAPMWAGLTKLSDADFLKLAGWPAPTASRGAQAGGIGSDAAASAHVAPLPPLAPSLQAPTARLSPETEALLAKLPPAQAEDLRKAGFAGVLEAEQDKARADAVEGATRADGYQQRIDNGDKTLTPREIEEDVVLKADQKAELGAALKAKNQEIVETDQNVDKFTTGELKFDGYSEANQAAVDHVWERVSTWGDTPEKVLPLLNGLIRQTGIVPSQVIRDIRQGLNSKDPAAVLGALQQSTQLMSRWGDAVSRSKDGGAIDNAIIDLQSKMDDRGLSFEQAVDSYIQDNDPAKRQPISKAELDEALRWIFLPDHIIDLFDARGGRPRLGFDTKQSEEYINDYKSFLAREAQSAPNLEIARARATAKFKRKYGVTSVSGIPTIVKYPAESYHNNVGDSKAWMGKRFRVLLDEVRTETGDDSIMPDQIVPEPSDDIEQRLAAHSPPAYRIFVDRKGENGEIVRQEIRPGKLFIFDEAAAIKGQKKIDLAKERKVRESLLQKMEYLRQDRESLIRQYESEQLVSPAFFTNLNSPLDPDQLAAIERGQSNWGTERRIYKTNDIPEDFAKQRWEAEHSDGPGLATMTLAEQQKNIRDEQQKIADGLNNRQGQFGPLQQQIENIDQFVANQKALLKGVSDTGVDEAQSGDSWVEVGAPYEDNGTFQADRPQAPAAFPSMTKLLVAVWRHSMPTGSFLSDKMLLSDRVTVDPALDPINELKDPKYWRHIDEAVNIHNRPTLEAFKAQIDMEEEDQATIEAAGWIGAALSIVAGAADPTNFVTIIGPAGKAFRVGKYVISAPVVDILRSAANGAGTAAIQNAILDASQVGRQATGADIIENIFKDALGTAAFEKFKQTPEYKKAMDVLRKVNPFS